MEQVKKELCNLIFESNDFQEFFKESEKTRKELEDLESSKQFYKDKIEKHNGRTKKLFEKQNEELLDEIQKVSSEYSLMLNKEGLDNKNNEIVEKYMNISERHKEQLLDVAFIFRSSYEGGSKTFKNIIEKINKEGGNVQIVNERYRGRNTQDAFGGWDTDFIVLMPAATYEQFNDMIHKDQAEPRLEVIGERSEFFFMNHLNMKVDIDKFKQLVQEKIDKKESMLISEIFNRYGGVGYTDISGSNYKSRQKISSAIKTYFSQINDMEGEKQKNNEYYIQTTKSIATSALVYKKSSDNEEYSGKIVTPLKEATIFKDKNPKLFPEVKRKQKRKP